MSDNISTFGKSEKTKFWIEDPAVLFSDLQFLPVQGMTREEKLNALTRLSVLISIGMNLAGWNEWLTFLLGSVLITTIINYSNKIPNPILQENFSVVPTRIGDDFEVTAVSPSFSEEMRVPSPAYDLYTNVDISDPPFFEPIRGQSYPYGQYLTKTNLLPSDEYSLAMNSSGGAKSAREYAGSTFMKNDLAFRENMTRIYKKQIDRRFRHNMVGETFSPFNSY